MYSMYYIVYDIISLISISLTMARTEIRSLLYKYNHVRISVPRNCKTPLNKFFCVASYQAINIMADFNIKKTLYSIS